MSTNNPPRPLNITVLAEDPLTVQEVRKELTVFQNSPSFQSVSPMISHQVRLIYGGIRHSVKKSSNQA
ncbi:hypothetical protein IWQ61_003193 [Dispira simplex]|nr:hypothetical protein IWQ61_003193 [Dispira simplex]